jgi:transcription-repair coupling factor (superfamily II helicase)
VVRIRNIGGRLGFEKIIIKNGLFIAFFVANKMSPYYKSDTFQGVVTRISENPSLFELKQSEDKLKIVSRGITSMEKAEALLRKLQ